MRFLYLSQSGNFKNQISLSNKVTVNHFNRRLARYCISNRDSCVIFKVKFNVFEDCDKYNLRPKMLETIALIEKREHLLSLGLGQNFSFLLSVFIKSNLSI